MSTYTPLCELLGIEHPIVSAPLAAIPGCPQRFKCRRPRHPGAVVGRRRRRRGSRNGRADRSAVRRQLRSHLGSAPSSRSGPFRRSAGRVVHLGRSRQLCRPVHDAGGLVLHTVGSAEEARRAVGCGVDIIVAQGWEAGGHVWGGVATLPLVPAVVDAVAPVPSLRRVGSATLAASRPCSPSARRPPGWARGSSWPMRCRSTRSTGAA